MLSQLDDVGYTLASNPPTNSLQLNDTLTAKINTGSYYTYGVWWNTSLAISNANNPLVSPLTIGQSASGVIPSVANYLNSGSSYICGCCYNTAANNYLLVDDKGITYVTPDLINITTTNTTSNLYSILHPACNNQTLIYAFAYYFCCGTANSTYCIAYSSDGINWAGVSAATQPYCGSLLYSGTSTYTKIFALGSIYGNTSICFMQCTSGNTFTDVSTCVLSNLSVYSGSTTAF